jgi:hypothetical protein
MNKSLGILPDLSVGSEKVPPMIFEFTPLSGHHYERHSNLNSAPEALAADALPS